MDRELEKALKEIAKRANTLEAKLERDAFRIRQVLKGMGE